MQAPARHGLQQRADLPREGGELRGKCGYMCIWVSTWLVSYWWGT